MSAPLLASVDLNLLVVLDELFRCGSTVKAAQRLGKTQSAVSHALKRLRELLGDPLFIRAGSALVPTAVALSLREPLRAILGSTEAMLFGKDSFDPASLARVFTLGAADFAEVIVLPRLLALLRERAPLVDLATRFAGDDVDRAIQAGEVDLALGAGFRPLSGLMVQPLYEERFVCVVRRDHPRVGEQLTLPQFVAEEHALASPRGQAGSYVDAELERLGHRRRVILRTTHFTSALLLAAQTDVIVTAPSRLARAIAAFAPVRLVTPPLDLPTFRFGCLYSAARQKDPAHAWLRALLGEALRDGEKAP